MKANNFLYPDGISDKWIRRFKLLEFTFDSDDCLYTPKTWDSDWEKQVKCLWLRVIGVSPVKIAKDLDVGLSLVKNYWLSNITRNYKLQSISKFDWSTIGYVDENQQRFVYSGGAQDVRYHGNFKDDGGLDTKISPQLCMDGELLQHIHDYEDRQEPKDSNPSDDLYKKYYGDYKD